MIRLTVDIKMTMALSNLLPERSLTRITRAVANDETSLIKNHFIDRAQKTNSRWYWGQAAENTQVTHNADSSDITINHVGVRLHLQGGIVRPTGQISRVTGKPISSLLIPTSDSPLRKRGVSLSELGIPQDQITVLKSKKTGRAYLAWIRPAQGKTSRSKPKVFPLGILVKQAKHNPDRTVLPSDEELTSTARNTAIEIITSILTGT